MNWENFYKRFREPNFIPGYEIQNRLGGGSFGEVYKGRKESIGKAYAIKFLKLDDEAQLEAVERELEQVRHFAALDHPNLVSIEDMGTVMEVPYLIMGYAGEDTLSRRLKEDRLTREQAVLYFVQASRGVLALHDRRLVHFDLKPSNIFLKGDVARVGDYGLSKLMVDGRMTLSFGRGTPQYMAPEMIRSRADHRADIYSLGVILYESLTGKLPFEPESPGTLVLRDDDDPPPFPEGFPEELVSVVTRCLHKSPDDRYDGVCEMLEAMDQTARPGDSVVMRPPARTADGPNGVSVKSGQGADPQTPAGRVQELQRAAGDLGRAAKSAGKIPAERYKEIHQTAAEFARGAVGVAKTVIDGLRTGGQAATRASKEAGGAAGTDLAEGSTPPVYIENSAPVSGQLPPGAREAVSAQPSSPDTDVGAKESPNAQSGGQVGGNTGSNTGSQVGAQSTDEQQANRVRQSARLHRTATTIPVPPPVTGGVLGTLWSTFQLALEVFVAIVVGTARAVSGGFGFVSGSVARKTSGAGSRVLRLLLFLILLSVVGAVLMFLVLLVFN